MGADPSNLNFGDLSRYFVSFHLPGSDKITTIIQQNSTPSSSIDIEAAQGFVFTSFPDKKKQPDVFIKPDIVLQHKPIHNCQFTNTHLLKDKTAEKDISRTAYLDLIKQTVATLKNGPLQKVVISRTITRPIPTNFNSITLFNALAEKYPNAFTYVLNIPEQGLWVGATPEVLLSIADGSLKTTSLAGTKKREENDIVWTDKELEEQDLVSRYIENIFHRFGVKDVSISKRGNKDAGKIAHLHTTFTTKPNALKNKLSEFLEELHPTPAICGVSKEGALNYIQSHENYCREYYTGFLGPVGLEGATNLFVNIRCLQVTANEIKLYVGGGITDASIPEDEWDETCLKADTLLNVIEEL